jgi:oligosaccharide repeat unit polymerase
MLAIFAPLCLGMAAYGLISDNAGAVYSSISIVIFVIPALIGLSRPKFDIFEPINVAAFSILFGTTLRSFYIILFPDRPRAEFLMMDQTFGEINSRVFLVLLGVISLCLGYIISSSRFPLEKLNFVKNYSLSRPKFTILVLLSIIITIIGIIAFLLDFHVHLSLNIYDILSESRKRTAQYINKSGQTVYGAGWETIVAQTTRFTFVIYAAGMLSRNMRVKLRRILIVIVLFILSSIVPFLTSTRTSIVLDLFTICVLAYYFNRLNLRTAIIGFAAVVFVVAGMGSIRAAGRASEGSDVIDFTIGSGNGFDTIRTTAIMERVPRDHDYKYGSSYIVIPFFFVPRAIWPDKPEVGLGAWTKRVLFHQKRVQNAGWPPTVVGEAWINFGLIGILVVPFLVGMFFRYIYESCRPLLGRSLPVTAVYSVAAYKLGFNCVELDLSVGLVSTFGVVVPLMFVLWLARGRGGRPLPRTAFSPVRVRA